MLGLSCSDACVWGKGKATSGAKGVGGIYTRCTPTYYSLFLLISEHVTPLTKQSNIAILEDTTRMQATNQKPRMRNTVDVYAIIVAGRVCAYL